MPQTKFTNGEWRWTQTTRPLCHCNTCFTQDPWMTLDCGIRRENPWAVVSHLYLPSPITPAFPTVRRSWTMDMSSWLHSVTWRLEMNWHIRMWIWMPVIVNKPWYNPGNLGASVCDVKCRPHRRSWRLMKNMYASVEVLSWNEEWIVSATRYRFNSSSLVWQKLVCNIEYLYSLVYNLVLWFPILLLSWESFCHIWHISSTMVVGNNGRYVSYWIYVPVLIVMGILVSNKKEFSITLLLVLFLSTLYNVVRLMILLWQGQGNRWWYQHKNQVWHCSPVTIVFPPR